MPTFTANQLRCVGQAIFQAVGAPGDVVQRVSGSLVANNLMGHDSHGVIRIPSYLEKIEEGEIVPQARPEVVQETATTALLDGHWAFGQVVATRGMEIAIAKAEEQSIAAVGIFNCPHIGRVGEYPTMAAQQGMVGIAICNSGPLGGLVAPFGGRKPFFSTNPLALAVPADDHPPLLVDFATSIVAEGKVRVARNRGERIPEGWIVDSEGHPSTDPHDLYEGGALQPFGRHKGYGLSLFIDILGGILTGAGCTSMPDYEGGNGTLMIALDVESFRPLEEFKAYVDRLFAAVKDVPLAPDFEEILIPGEPEYRTKAQREREGIFVEEVTWEQIVEEAQGLGVDLDGLLERD
ncbi:MAG: Ldh family oxidoreductase [Chloroflexota bacterium]|nr:Ldh family oxidoreductase [Chloroflexota bacterium]